MTALRTLKLTPGQLHVWLTAYPHLLTGEPNCGRLYYLSGTNLSESSWRGYMERLVKKGVFVWRRKGNARLWSLGPVADLLIEEGILP